MSQLYAKIIAASCFIWVTGASTATANVCPRTSSGAVDLQQFVGSGNRDNNCDYTPNGMRIKLYKILLCSQLPSLANYETLCKPLVDFSSGKNIDITADGTSPIIDGPVTLTEGLYTHAVILIENRIGSKFTETFSHPIQGNNAVGTTCWSNGNDAKISYESAALGPGDYTKFSASCGTASDANPQWSYYTYKGLWNPQKTDNWDPQDATKDFFVNSVPYLTYTGSGKDVHLLSDFSTLASITSGAAGRNRDDENGIVSNASYLMGVTKFTTAANINANTRNIDLGFKLKDTFFQKITTNNNYYNLYTNPQCSKQHAVMDINNPSPITGAHACLSTSYATTFDFKFEVQ